MNLILITSSFLLAAVPLLPFCESNANAFANIDQLIIGSFIRTSNAKTNEFKEYLEAMEFSSKDIAWYQNTETCLVDISKHEKNEYIMLMVIPKRKDKSSSSSSGSSQTERHSFFPGWEFPDELPDGREYKAKVTFKGDNELIRDERHKGFFCHHEFLFDKEGFDVTFMCKDKKVTQRFKRI